MCKRNLKTSCHPDTPPPLAYPGVYIGTPICLFFCFIIRGNAPGFLAHIIVAAPGTIPFPHPDCTLLNHAVMFMFDIKCMHDMPSNLSFDTAHYITDNTVDFLLSVGPVPFNSPIKFTPLDQELSSDFIAK
jgi:hypothetical protein